MTTSQELIAELKQESINTKRILSIVPPDQFGWKPHEKSMTLMHLSQHIAGLTGWIDMILNSEELDISKDKEVKYSKDIQELMNYLDENINKSLTALEKASEDIFDQPWKLKMEDEVIFELPKKKVIRTMVLNHIYHHRGQLSVYLRLLDVKIPGMYGPSADKI